MTDNEQLARPWQVSTAVKLIYAVFAIEMFRIAMEPKFEMMGETLSVGIAFYAVGATLFTLWFFIHMIGKGENSARIIFLVLIMLTAPSSILDTILSLNDASLKVLKKMDQGPDILGLAEMAMLMTAAVLLLQGSSSFWFKVMKQSKSKT